MLQFEYSKVKVIGASADAVDFALWLDDRAAGKADGWQISSKPEGELVVTQYYVAADSESTLTWKSCREDEKQQGIIEEKQYGTPTMRS